ncbi:MAG: hypothetical protein F6J98_05530 [Moorea sp. SIO4G2]|nr:hypothetical protein [Moorena sp. SIO4G2]
MSQRTSFGVIPRNSYYYWDTGFLFLIIKTPLEPEAQCLMGVTAVLAEGVSTIHTLSTS